MKSIFLESSPFEIGLLAVFALSLLIQLFYYLFIYIRIGLYKTKQPEVSKSKLPPISVVICARNEELNLEALLPSVLEQDYPEFEVIVVDDCSFDNTDIILKKYKNQYKHLRSTIIKQDAKFSHGKKLALTIGIKAAKHEWLVLTDADCMPLSKNWLITLASNFNGDTEIILGYSGYKPERGLLNRIIRFDTFYIGLNYLSFALWRKPYMGVGRNLAYRKELFFKNRGFASHGTLHSGDDDLFVHEVATKKNTTVEFGHDSQTLSNPRKTFSSWVLQKRRHLTTGPRYRTSIKIWLTLEPFSRLLFWISAIWMFVDNYYPIVIGSAVAFRLLTSGIILKIAMNRLCETKLFLISFIYDLFSPLLYFWLSIANKFNTRQFRWN